MNKTVTLSELASCTLTFAVTPAENAKVTVTHPVGGTIKPETDGGYKLYLGETYAYTVAKAGYIPVHGSITAAEDKTLSFTLTYAGEGWDGTAKTAPTQDKTASIRSAPPRNWHGLPMRSTRAARPSAASSPPTSTSTARLGRPSVPTVISLPAPWTAIITPLVVWQELAD